MSRVFHHAAIAIIRGIDGQILISKRPLHKLKGGYWEFPGGKLELGEEPKEALIRELQEELGIKASTVSPFMQYEYDYDAHYRVLLEVFLVTDFEGTPRSMEGQELEWITLTEWQNYPFLAPNKVIIEKLLQQESTTESEPTMTI